MSLLKKNLVNISIDENKVINYGYNIEELSRDELRILHSVILELSDDVLGCIRTYDYEPEDEDNGNKEIPHL